MRLQPYHSWFYSVRCWVKEMSGQSAKRIAGYEFYQEMHMDGFRPKQAAEEAVFQAGKEETMD